MARAKKETTALANYEERIAALRKQTKEQEKNIGGGQFFSLAGGQLRLGGNRLPGDKVGGVIIDAIAENVFYEGAYDPENRAAPTCYAFGRNEEDMAPHPEAPNPVSDKCATCPNNEWGSGSGNGKACKNRRRLAIIPAGQFDGDDFELNEDPDHYATAEVAYLPLPPTQLKGYATYTRNADKILGKPPCLLVTEIAVGPNPKTQIQVDFETLAEAPNELLPTLLDRNEEQQALTAFPYAKAAAEEAPKPKRAKGKSARKPAAKKARGGYSTSKY
jgi:hypothetical protein